MKLNRFQRKNFIIFGLVMMLGLIGYINFSLNKQALLQTSSELEKYEMTMMKESGILTEILGEDEMVLSEEISEKAEEAEEAKESEEISKQKEMDNAMIVDSRDNFLNNLAQTTNSQITQVITNKEIMKTSTFFIETRLERDKKRSEMISNLNEIINNNNTGQDLRDQAQSMKLGLIASTEKEMMIESMVMAKGYRDVVVYLSDQSINIVVQSEGLNSTDVAKIVDIVRRETEISMDNIIIMNKK